jgi:hypothetical protein
MSANLQQSGEGDKTFIASQGFKPKQSEELVISLFDRKTDNKPKERTITWTGFCARVKEPYIRSQKDGSAFAPARFEPAHRLKENVRAVSMLVFDIDEQIELAALREKLRPLECAFCVYSTHSHKRHTEKNPEAETRWRVSIPLAVPYAQEDSPSAFENFDLWQTVNDALSLDADTQAKDVSRMHYAPAKVSNEAEYEYTTNAGVFFDWRGFLASQPEQVTSPCLHETNAAEATHAQETSHYQTHEERHAELCRRIEQRAKLNIRGALEMKCPAHKGNGETSLVYFPTSGSVKCLKGCDYFAILRAFGLPDERLPSKERAAAKDKAGQNKNKPLHTVKLSDVEKKEVNWLWRPLIAQGAFTIIEGEEGIGKSWLLCAIACAVAQGYGLPNSEPSIIANVLLLSAEDSLSFTLKPRLETMNAPCERIIAVDELFTLDADGIHRLELAIAEHTPRLIVIDPLFAYTGKAHLDKDNEIRSVTSELARLAEKYECAVVGVRHIGKAKGLGDPRAAGLNGIGWRASARSVLLVGKDPDNEARKAIAQTKNNLAERSATAIGFEIIGNQFMWTGESTLTATQMLALARSADEQAEHTEAVAFLREALQDGRRNAGEVEREADKLGITKQRLRTARAKLGIKPRSEGFGKDKKWFWELPTRPRLDVVDPRLDVGANGNQHLSANESDKTSYGNDLRLDVDSYKHQHLSNQNQHLSAVAVPTGGKPFDASPDTPNNQSEQSAAMPLVYNYPCWTCGTSVSNQDSRCPNCEQDLNDLPF